MTPDEARRIVAAQVIHHAADQAVEDDWDVYPEVGEWDWERIGDEVATLAPPPPPALYAEAYALLEARADKDGTA